MKYCSTTSDRIVSVNNTIVLSNLEELGSVLTYKHEFEILTNEHLDVQCVSVTTAIKLIYRIIIIILEIWKLRKAFYVTSECTSELLTLLHFEGIKAVVSLGWGKMRRSVVHNLVGRENFGDAGEAFLIGLTPSVIPAWAFSHLVPWLSIVVGVARYTRYTCYPSAYLARSASSYQMPSHIVQIHRDAISIRVIRRNNCHGGGPIIHALCRGLSLSPSVRVAARNRHVDGSERNSFSLAARQKSLRWQGSTGEGNDLSYIPIDTATDAVWKKRDIVPLTLIQ